MISAPIFETYVLIGRNGICSGSILGRSKSLPYGSFSGRRETRTPVSADKHIETYIMEGNQKWLKKSNLPKPSCVMPTSP